MQKLQSECSNFNSMGNSQILLIVDDWDISGGMHCYLNGAQKITASQVSYLQRYLVAKYLRLKLWRLFNT